MTINEMRNLVRNTRRLEYNDWEGMIHSPPLMHTVTNNSIMHNFILFDSWYYVSTNERTRLIGWGHYELIHLMKLGEKHFFVDCTFSCVPEPFTQLMIIMMYEQATDTYIPVFYVLMQSKLEVVYKLAINLCKTASDDLMQAKSITCDFEIGLINALQFHFEKTIIVGCLFHWKQSIRRKLGVLKIPVSVISSLVDSNGLLNILTEIPIPELAKGIAFIRHTFDEREFVEQFDNFWKYFVRTWVNTYEPKLWNVNGVTNPTSGKSLIVNRTNNPLERFNLKLGTSFSKFGTPRMADFVTTIKDISEQYYSEYNMIKNGHFVRTSNVHKEVTVHTIPSTYYSFKCEYSYESIIPAEGKGMIASHSYLVGTMHFDNDEHEKGYYVVTEIGFVKHKGKDVFVGYRKEVPCLEYPMKSDTLVEDYITVVEILKFMKNEEVVNKSHITISSGSSNKRRKM
jgi:hypothetical protein